MSSMIYKVTVCTALCLSVALVGLAGGCGSAEVDGSASNTETEAVQSTGSSGYSTQYTIDDLKNATWSDMMFAIGGKVYALPFSYADISDDWHLPSYDADDVVEGNTTVCAELENDGYQYYPDEFSVGLYNESPAEADIKDCVVTWATFPSVTSEFRENWVEITLPGGITYGDTLSAVESAYGEPDELETFAADSDLSSYSEDEGEVTSAVYRQYTDGHDGERLLLTFTEKSGLVQIYINCQRAN